MKLLIRWRNKDRSAELNPISKVDAEVDVRSRASTRASTRASKKSKKKSDKKKSKKKKKKSSSDKNKTDDDDEEKQPKWALSRPPPVQTSYDEKPVVDQAAAAAAAAAAAGVTPRISIELSMQELQDEALARGIERQYMPNSKIDLLEFLVDGSIHLRKTKAWWDIERLRSRMKADCRRIEEERSASNTASLTVSQPHNDYIDHENGDKFLLPTGGGVGNLIDFDIPDPVTFSTRDHSHLSSLQSTLPSRQVFQSYKRRGDRDRSIATRPDMSFNTTEMDESAVGTLFKIFPMTCGLGCSGGKQPQRNLISNGNNNDSFSKVSGIDRRTDERMEDAMQRRNHQEKETQQQQHKLETLEMQQKMMIKWDASVQFEPWIISPPDNNKKPTGSMMKGFTVWCSISSDIMDNNPTKQFDATYKNLSDANDRARYLFYWRNPWRVAPPTMVDLVLIKSDNSGTNDCASTFHCVHPNGDKWIVSVVHDSTFKYLDNATSSRHSLDQY